MKRRKYLPLFIGGLWATALASVSAALAAPVTAADLTGKKICWDNGNVSTFLPGGKFSSNRSGNGTWAMTAGGVETHTEHWSGVSANFEKMPDGTFQQTGSGKSGKPWILTGRYCN
jgi:hypothetical protein